MKLRDKVADYHRWIEWNWGRHRGEIPLVKAPLFTIFDVQPPLTKLEFRSSDFHECGRLIIRERINLA